MGTESFRQQYTGVEEGRGVTYLQTPVLYWVGGTYQYTGPEFILPGLAPFVDATLGFAVTQGPVGRTTAGLAYQPWGPLRFTVGLDASAMGYQHNAEWFASTKWGLSYGLSIDLGSVR